MIKQHKIMQLFLEGSILDCDKYGRGPGVGETSIDHTSNGQR